MDKAEYHREWMRSSRLSKRVGRWTNQQKRMRLSVARNPTVTTRLSRQAAIAYLLAVLAGEDVPFLPREYKGGASQIVADATCLSRETIQNYRRLA